eukprot:10392475-Alexandrium_andersonii.AAC.1
MQELLSDLIPPPEAAWRLCLLPTIRPPLSGGWGSRTRNDRAKTATRFTKTGWAGTPHPQQPSWNRGR